jgi:hypothetical protein
MEEFKEAFTKMCTDNVTEASLFALSALALRHIQKVEEERYTVINDVLENNEFDSPEMGRVQDIYDKVINYDKQLIDCLTNIEKDIAYDLKGEKPKNQENQEVEKQRQDIKKWWE